MANYLIQEIESYQKQLGQAERFARGRECIIKDISESNDALRLAVSNAQSDLHDAQVNLAEAIADRNEKADLLADLQREVVPA